MLSGGIDEAGLFLARWTVSQQLHRGWLLVLRSNVARPDVAG